ncbi:MAG: hypothetical protein CMF26_06055 [Kiloniella sp.]|nr:hypothetical protein [Kiloniella sp.]
MARADDEGFMYILEDESPSNRYKVDLGPIASGGTPTYEILTSYSRPDINDFLFDPVTRKIYSVMNNTNKLVTIVLLDPSYPMNIENPRVIRVTRGKAARADFGAQIDRIVRLDLNRCAFAGSGAELTRESAAGMTQLLGTLHQSRSRLRIAYRTNEDGPKEVAARKAYLEQAIEAM